MSDKPLPQYRWPYPDHIASFSSLNKQGLQLSDGQSPAGRAWTKHQGWIYVYDTRQAIPKTEETKAKERDHRRKLEAERKARRTCHRCKKVQKSEYHLEYGYCGPCSWIIDKERHIKDLKKSVAWARKLMRTNDWIIIDTETTSLTGFMVQIAIIDHRGEPLINTLVNPEAPIEPGAYRVHGIDAEQLIDELTFRDLYPLFEQIIEGKRIIAYNAEFDYGIVANEYYRLKRAMPKNKWVCAMLQHSAVIGDWSEKYEDYQWQPLPMAAHDAVADCVATLRLIERIASIDKFDYEHRFEIANYLAQKVLLYNG